MSFYKLDNQSSRKDYYRVFLLVWPTIFFVPFYALLKLVFHVSWSMFIGLYVLCTGIVVLVGAPLFYWARRRSEFSEDPRPIILASGLTVLSGIAPLVFFLVRPMGFDPLAALVTACLAVVPWVVLYFSPPTKLYERFRLKRVSPHSLEGGSDTSDNETRGGLTDGKPFR